MTVSLAVGWILATALLSSVLTRLLALACWRLFLKARLEAEWEALANPLREQVKEGVTAAGQELLPAFRQDVEAGFRDALTSGIAARLFDKTAGMALRTGVSLVSPELDFVRTIPPPEADKTAPTPKSVLPADRDLRFRRQEMTPLGIVNLPVGRTPIPQNYPFSPLSTSRLTERRPLS